MKKFECKASLGLVLQGEFLDLSTSSVSSSSSSFPPSCLSLKSRTFLISQEGLVERGLALLVAHAELGPLVQQVSHDLHVAVQASPVEGVLPSAFFAVAGAPDSTSSFTISVGRLPPP